MAAIREVPPRFAVAFSFAGAQRDVVLPIAQEVEAILGRSTVFYDDWYEHWIAGADADLRLQKLYGDSSELVVCCISGDYGDRAWTRTEHRAIRARLMQEGPPRSGLHILPLRVGDGDVDGVLFNDIVPDVRARPASDSAALIIARLNLARATSDGVVQNLPAWPSEPPDLHWPMADHGEARQAFAALISESSPVRALLVCGASETGKSHMSKQMARNGMTLAGVRCGRLDLKGTTNMQIEVEAFSRPLGIDPPTKGPLTGRLGAILNELRRRSRPTLLIFDSYEAAGEAGDWVENVLLPYVMSAPWLRIVIIGQSVPKRVGTTWESFAAGTLTLLVPGPEHWLEYGRANRGGELELTFVAQAHQLSGGKASVLAGLLGPRP